MRYQFIAADPPWHFATYSAKGRKKSPKYATMTNEDIAALDVASIAAEDCILGLWCTWPLLLTGIRVGQAWGFEYKTCLFNWVKQTLNGKGLFMSTGYYTRANSEPCLLFTRGKPGKLVRDHGVHQIIETSDAPTLPGFDEVLSARVGRHSAKPEQFYRRVEQLLYPHVTKLELFARVRRANWAVIGNEINGLDVKEALRVINSMKRKDEMCCA